MAKQIDIELKGIGELQALLARVGNQAGRALAGPLFRWGEQHIQIPARDRYVPVVDSILKNSIHIFPATVQNGAVVVLISAGGASVKYAVAVHENPRSGKTGGFSPSGKKYARWSRVGQWKYLETPAKEAAAHPEPLIDGVRKAVEQLVARRG